MRQHARERDPDVAPRRVAPPSSPISATTPMRSIRQPAPRADHLGAAVVRGRASRMTPRSGRRARPSAPAASAEATGRVSGQAGVTSCPDVRRRRVRGRDRARFRRHARAPRALPAACPPSCRPRTASRTSDSGQTVPVSPPDGRQERLGPCRPDAAASDRMLLEVGDFTDVARETRARPGDGCRSLRRVDPRSRRRLHHAREAASPRRGSRATSRVSRGGVGHDGG